MIDIMLYLTTRVSVCSYIWTNLIWDVPHSDLCNCIQEYFVVLNKKVINGLYSNIISKYCKIKIVRGSLEVVLRVCQRKPALNMLLALL